MLCHAMLCSADMQDSAPLTGLSACSSPRACTTADEHGSCSHCAGSPPVVMQHPFQVEQLRRQQQQVSRSAHNHIVLVSCVRKAVC